MAKSEQADTLRASEGGTTPFAVVTGASSGIGLELAKEFARHGFDLLVTAESERIEAAADELRSFGPRIATFRADLATPGGVEALWARIQEEGRSLDAIAINAELASPARSSTTRSTMS